jgi:hypothetical protein
MEDPMSEFLRTAMQGVQNWVSQNATHYLSVAIPKERTDTNDDDAPLVPYQSYVRFWLSEMFLTQNVSWFREWCPAVHASVQLNYGGQPSVRFDKVAGLPEELQSKGVVLNFGLTELMPYNGGTVEMTAGLLAIPMKQSPYVSTAIKVISDFAGLVVPPLGTALAISKKVATGIEQFMNVSGGQVHVGIHQSFNSEGGGGGHNLRPGYIAVILASEDQVPSDSLLVKRDRLWSNHKGESKPLEGYDYMLFRVEGRKERDDWRLRDIQEPIDFAVQAWLKGNEEEAKAFTVTALTAAYRSADLAVHDRRRVIQAIKAELQQIQDQGLGIRQDENSDLNNMMDRQAIDLKKALQMPPITITEALEGQLS